MHCCQKRNGFLFLVYLFIMLLCTAESWPTKGKKKNICIIGAGVSGLGAARIITKHLDKFDLVVFEKNSDVGGQWLYTDRTDLDEHGLPVQSSVWKNMKTNIWFSLMQYPDYDILGEYNENNSEEEEPVLHNKVFEYLKDYVRRFNLRRFIRFNTLVTMVSPMNYGDNGTSWLVTTKDFNLKRTSKIVCDAVMVCNGHNSKPRMPDITGLKTYPGQVIHSHSYRRPDKYIGKTVLVLGSGDSGLGISKDLVDHGAKKVYLSHNYDRGNNVLSYVMTSSKVINVKDVATVKGRDLLLSDGSWLEDTDAIILCTGYVGDLTFLDPKIGAIVTDARSGYVTPVTDNLFHAYYPTLAFLGLYDAAINNMVYNQSEKFVDFMLHSSSSTQPNSDKKGFLSKFLSKIHVKKS